MEDSRFSTCWRFRVERHARRCAVALVVLATLGCARVSVLPSKGGAAWLEVRSENFTIWTNTSSAAARALAQRFEAQRRVVLAAIRKPLSAPHTFVIALRSLREYRAMFAELSVARAWTENNPALQPMIVMSLDHSEDHVLNHEFAHVLSFSLVRHQPRWLAEGLATYFESAIPDLQTGVAQLGLPNESLRRFLTGRDRMPRMRTLFECQSNACADPEFYAASWLLFSYLTNRHNKRFGIYLALIDRGVDHARAWSAVFPELSPELLDRSIGWDLRKLKLPEVKVPLSPVPTEVRAIGDAEVLAARALLYYLTGDEQARPEASAALALTPTHLLASLVLAATRAPLSADQLRALTDAHPDDSRAWFLRSELAADSTERQQASARACQLAPRTYARCAAATADDSLR